MCSMNSGVKVPGPEDVSPAGGKFGRLLLQFPDPIEEEEFVQALQVINRRPTRRTLACALVLIFFECCLHRVWVLFQHGDAAVVFNLVVRGLTMLTLILFLRLAWKDTCSFETLSLWTQLMMSFYLISINSYRLSKIFGTEFPYKHFTSKDVCPANDMGFCYDMDSSLLLSLSVLVTATSITVNIRVCRSWPVFFTSFIYLLISVPGLGPLPFKGHFLLFVLLTTLVSFNWYGCLLRERETRKSWQEMRTMRLELEAQKQAFRAQERWLREVEERLLAVVSLSSPELRPQPEQVPMITRGPEPASLLSMASRCSVEAPPPRDLTCPAPEQDWHAEALYGAVNGCGIVEAEVEEPNNLLRAAMREHRPDHTRLRKMARCIRDPQYSMRDFFEDCLATLPELQLFFAGDRNMRCRTSSGHNAEKEYQRTISALLCVYWLLRLKDDGKRGFCYGVDEQWEILQEASGTKKDRAKREDFLRNMDWEIMSQVVDLAIGDSEDRIEAMLALTAFHDIMKCSYLCPFVASEHAPYRGFPAGAIIHDHDIALAYVLEHYPQILPSFSNLPPGSREVVLFTQNKMQFNHGWFVQAEAPPGAMLSAFKQVLAGSTKDDLAFYFLHWLTDLAGAQGTPLGGAEKFVLAFPRPVLESFLWSIPFLQTLAGETETRVVEKYLEARFRVCLPMMQLPKGAESIPVMRLVAMAQRSDSLVMDAFSHASPWVRSVLSLEMSRTGISDQLFARSPAPGGPAFLVYYGPALLQRCSTLDEMIKALTALAAVYQAGRCIWPESVEESGRGVTLEIGQLKSVCIDEAIGGSSVRDVWVLRQSNDKEAVAELATAMRVNDLFETGVKFCCIELTRSLFAGGRVQVRGRSKSSDTQTADAGQARATS